MAVCAHHCSVQILLYYTNANKYKFANILVFWIGTKQSSIILSKMKNFVMQLSSNNILLDKLLNQFKKTKNKIWTKLYKIILIYKKFKFWPINLFSMKFYLSVGLTGDLPENHQIWELCNHYTVSTVKGYK